ncbi:MAG TPA: PIN domain-containing protein [Candidatus Saccharimonadales bacterium]|nr:PIN domain-containing protein [Candidatus Saccharimonadales bacterium]
MEKKETTPKPVEAQTPERAEAERRSALTPNIIGAIADEVSKTLISRLPGVMRSRTRRKKVKKTKKIENAIFLDTSAIIDGRIFDVIYLGLLNGTVVITSHILLELKHLADTQNTVKRTRGRKGLDALEQLRKARQIKVIVLPEENGKPTDDRVEVDEQLIKAAKYHKGKIITSDYNLEKKASIDNVTAVNMNALANCLKAVAVPGESLHVKIAHLGKDKDQGVGYLDDGTMIVVEDGSDALAKEVDVVVSRIIQKATGRILFAKKI